MGLETTFRNLSQRLLKLQNKFVELQEFVDCKPDYDDAAVAHDFSDKTLELQGTIFEAKGWAKAALQSAVRAADIDKLRRALVQCQAKIQHVEEVFGEYLVSYDRLKELERVRSRNPDWSSWGRKVRETIEECRDPLARVSKAIGLCWEELAERSGIINVSVRTTGVVQNLAGVEKPKVEDFYRGGP